MWKIIHEKETKSFTFAHFKTEWTARRRKAGWESNPFFNIACPGQSTSKLITIKSNNPDNNREHADETQSPTPQMLNQGLEW